jgi:hypothetical protein
VSKILDHNWRWAHLYYIRSEEGIAKIKLRPEQKTLHEIVYDAFFGGYKEDIIILKDRQRGTSTDCNLLLTDLSAYYAGKVANTLADTRERASTMFENNVKFAWDRIPNGLKPKANRDNVNELNFSGIGSKYIVSASKSEPVDILHVSEAPYFTDDERIKEAEQMLRRLGIEIMESTAFGVGNLFEKRFMEAWLAKLAGKPHHRKALFFPWFTNPKNTVAVYPEMEFKNKAFIDELAARVFRVYGVILTEGQKHFYDQKFSDLDEEVFQYYPTEPEEAFLHSGRPVFNQEMLKALRAAHARSPLYVTEEGIEVYEEYKEGNHYGIGVDCSEGLAHGDNSSITVICQETGEEVAQVAGPISAIDEDDLARLLRVVCLMYPDHMCAIERNNHGHTLIAFTKHDPAIRLYQKQVKDKVTEKTELKIGWDTDERSKAYLIDTVKADMKQGKCIPHSFHTYDECRVFVRGERGKMAAMPGNKDDRVISLGLADLAARELIIPGSLDPAQYGIY